MTLKLNLNGSAEPFINYLKNYLRIRESLLLEIDTDVRAFVAKTFTEDRSSVRFASLTFDDANITVTEDKEAAQRNGQRVKVGVLIKLKKLIQIVERFGSDVNEKGESNFDIVIEYGPMERKDAAGNDYVDFVATEISFKSSILKMKMDGFRITEFTYLSDEDFVNRVFTVKDPVTVQVTSASIASIVKTSDIIKIDPRKDALVFFVENNTLYVKDQAEGVGKQPNFVYQIGALDHEATKDGINVPVSRERFIKILDKCEEDFNIILGFVDNDGYGDVMDRILFDSTTNSTKIVVSAMRDC